MCASWAVLRNMSVRERNVFNEQTLFIFNTWQGACVMEICRRNTQLLHQLLHIYKIYKIYTLGH